MSSYVPVALRRLARRRADGLCEYCLVHEADAYFGCEIEHVISEKHGGKTTASNLAWACALCNRLKGSDIGAIPQGSRQLIRLFNPRTDVWREHFRLRGARISAISDIGRATVRLLQLNAPSRLAERQVLALVGDYPSTAAQKRISGQ